MKQLIMELRTQKESLLEFWVQMTFIKIEMY